MTHLHVLDRYQETDSPVHRLDARVKLILTLTFVVAVTALPHGAWASYLLCLLTTVMITALTRIRPLLIFRRSMIAVPFALAALTLAFTVEGTPFLTLTVARSSLSVTYEGTVAFVSILVKAWLSVLMATLLAATTTFPELLAAMRALRIPKVIVSTISFMYRYVFVIVDEAVRLQRAKDARSAHRDGKKGGRLLWRSTVLGGMIGSLFLRSYERSERIYAAMLSRGFDGNIRTMREESLQPTHFMVAVMFVTYLAVIVALTNLLMHT